MPSLRTSVNNMCRACVAPEKAHGWRKEILHCCGYSCPLYQVRPIPKGSKVDSDMKPLEITEV